MTTLDGFRPDGTAARLVRPLSSARSFALPSASLSPVMVLFAYDVAWQYRLGPKWNISC